MHDIVNVLSATELFTLKWLIFKNLFIYFWLCWVFVAAQSFSSCGERGLLLLAVRGLLIVVASLVVEHRLQACRLQQL